MNNDQKLRNINLKNEKINENPNYHQKHFIIYSLGSVGIIPFSFFLYSFLLIYGVSMLGLPTFFVGTIYSVSQIIYALSLPLFGNLSDILKNSKLGTRKPLIIIGMPALILTYFFYWQIPPNTEFGTPKLDIAFSFICLMILYRFFYACVWASYYAMIPDMAKSEKSQLSLMTYMNIFNYIGQIIGTFLPIIILTQYPFINTAGEDYYWLLNPNHIGYEIQNSIFLDLIIMSILLILSFLGLLLLIKNPEQKEIYQTFKVKIKNSSIFSNIKSVIKDRNLTITYLTNVNFVIVVGSINYISINFALYTLNLGSYLYLFSVFLMISSFLSFFLSSFLAQKFGLKKILQFNSVFLSIFLLLLGILFLPMSQFFTQIWVFIIFLVISFITGSMGIYFGTIITKISSQTEHTLKKSISGNNVSLYQAFGVIGNVIAVLLVSFILEQLGTVQIQSYLSIFLLCGLFSMVNVGFIKKIQI